MNSFFKDFLIYGFASMVGKLAAIFLIPIYTNVLTREEYGAMALIVSCKGIIDLISNLNIHSGVSCDYYEYKNDRKRLVSTGFYSIAVISSLVFILVFACSGYLTKSVLGIPNYRTAFILMALSIPAGSLMSYFSIMTRYQKKPLLFSIGILIQLAIQITISIVGVVVLNEGVNSIFLGVLMGELFAVIYFAFLNKKNIGLTFKKKYLIRALRFALPTLPAILAGWADSSIGQIIVGRFISVEELGVYSLALQMASVFTLISTAFQNVWSPYLFENYKKENFRAEASSLFSIFVILLLGVTVVFSLYSIEIVQILSNYKYAKAAIYFPILCIPMSIYLLFPFVSSGILVSRQTKYIGISYVFGSVLNFISIIVLIRSVGIIAVPISLALSRVLTFIVLRYKSNTVLKIECPSVLLVLLSIIAVLSSILNYYCVDLIIRVVISIVIILCICRFLSKNYGIGNLLIIINKTK